METYWKMIHALYPNLLINEKFIRPDLYSVLATYEQVKNDRIEAKKNRDEVKNFFYKLILNSFTGILDSQYSWVYSPEYIMALRLMGQLVLSRLIEECYLNNFRVISVNTDGIEVKLKRNQLDLYYSIVNLVEKEFNLDFEHEFYKSIYYYSVNDYYAFTTEGKVKTKGEASSDAVLDGSNEFNVIPYAVQKYLENGISPEETIKNHPNLFDFCKAQKVDKKFKVYYNGKHIQQLNRYFVTTKKDGYYLYKSKDNIKMDALMKNIPVYICNEDIRNVNIKNYPIDYNWYIQKVWEKIKTFEPNQLNLFN
jgi:DNA polymerase elongation subunit (family B)